MQIHIHIHHHGPKGDEDVLHNVYTLTQLINSNINQMKTDLTGLEQEVSEVKTVQQSAITLLQGLKQRLDEAGTDQAKLDQLKSDLDASTNALAAAVAANTPAEGQPTGEEGPISPNPGGDTGGGQNL